MKPKYSLGGENLDIKWLNTMRVYDEYEKRFALANAKRDFSLPVTSESKKKITDGVKRMLAYDEKLIPSVSHMTEISKDVFDGYDVTHLKYETWEGFYGCAELYMPHGDRKVPLAFVFCGHGKNGRLSEGYVSMATRLVKMGIAVMVPDNIGQGSRSFQGHWDVVSPFYCGYTLQGLIVMESIALIRHMTDHPRVDKEKIAACGNSGGGTLCLFLAALAPELSVLSSSGYPSQFSYIFEKERKHCACNLLPGCMHGPDMWEILSLFAPKPLLIEEGRNDNLIPNDLFLRSARKVSHIYLQMGAEKNFKSSQTDTTHPWVNADRKIIAEFLAKHLGVEKPCCEDDRDDSVLKMSENWDIRFPSDSLTVDDLVAKLSGKKIPNNLQLSDIYKPMSGGKPLDKEDIVPDIGRGSVMRILAQMECALEEKNEIL